MLQHKFLYIFFTLAILSGCAQHPQPGTIISIAKRTQCLQQMQHWQASGRIAIIAANESVTAAFTWEQHDNKYRIHFSSPFSTESVTITGDEQQSKVVAANGETAEELQLEEQLPFMQLSSWLKGLVASHSTPQNAKYDTDNQLQSLQQDGWLIQFQSYNSTLPVSLPEKLTISDGHTKAKLLIKNWQK